MRIECEQCKGTSHLPNGDRCPCREEDDDAEGRRRQMRLEPARTRDQEA